MNEFEKALLNASPESTAFVRMSCDISDYVYFLLKKHKISIKDLAIKLNTDEETVERWLSGLNNLDLKTIAKIEIAIGKPLFWIPCYLADFTDAKTLFRIGFEIIIDDFKICWHNFLQKINNIKIFYHF